VRKKRNPFVMDDKKSDFDAYLLVLDHVWINSLFAAYSTNT